MRHTPAKPLRRPRPPRCVCPTLPGQSALVREMLQWGAAALGNILILLLGLYFVYLVAACVLPLRLSGVTVPVSYSVSRVVSIQKQPLGPFHGLFLARLLDQVLMPGFL